MALTVTLRKVFVTGDRKEVVADVLFDNSYLTGGEALTGTQLGLEGELNVIDATPALTGQTFSYDYTNAKLLAWVGGTQVANAVDLSAVTTRVVAVGKGSASA